MVFNFPTHILLIISVIDVFISGAFAPSQDALLILAGLFLVRFAYLYPENDQAEEARWAITIITLVALGALTYAGSFAIRYINNLPGDLAENQAFYLLTPLAILFAVSVFLRRSAHYESQADNSTRVAGRSASRFFKYVVHPTNRSAIALRNYGLALAISLVPVIGIIFEPLLPGALATFVFNFGAVIAVAAFMLTYLTYAPEPVTLSAKLVGLSLVSILLILGLKITVQRMER